MNEELTKTQVTEHVLACKTNDNFIAIREVEFSTLELETKKDMPLYSADGSKLQPKKLHLVNERKINPLLLGQIVDANVSNKTTSYSFGDIICTPRSAAYALSLFGKTIFFVHKDNILSGLVFSEKVSFKDKVEK